MAKSSPKDGEQDSTKESDNKSLKPVNFCGGLGHRRNPNLLCPSYNGDERMAKTNVTTIQTYTCKVIDYVTKLIINNKASSQRKNKENTTTAASTSTQEDILKQNFIKLDRHLSDRQTLRYPHRPTKSLIIGDTQ